MAIVEHGDCSQDGNLRKLVGGVDILSSNVNVENKTKTTHTSTDDKPPVV